MAEIAAPAMHAPATAPRTRALVVTGPLWAGAGVLLVAPFFAAFRSGGYGFDSQVLIAVVLFTALALVAVAAPWPPLPWGLPVAALGALTGYALWTGLSTGWARILDTASHDTYRVGMYCAAFALALAVMRVPSVRRVTPDVLLAGILLVSLYSLAGRLLPGLAHERVTSARLSQPLTYWNALGLFAGFGVLLGIAIAGDIARARAWRALACAAAVPCGLVAFLTLSRGAAASVAAGLVVLLVLRRGRATLLAAACALVPLLVLAVVLQAFPEVLSFHRGGSRQESQGAAFLPIAVAGTAVAGLALARFARSGFWRAGPWLSPRARRRLAIAAVPTVLVASVAVAGHGQEKTQVPSGAARLVQTQTNRGHYWRVALDAHSLYIETLAELGLVGAALLLGFIVAVAAGTVRAIRAAPRDPVVIAAAAVLGAFAAHAAIDWDWEMPAVSLIPLILAGAVLRTKRTDASARAG